MIDSYLFENAISERGFPGAEHVYLESNFDFLCEGPLREDLLNLRHHSRVDNSSFGSDGVHLLADPGDDGEVLGEVRGQDPRDSPRVQILQLGGLCNEVGLVSAHKQAAAEFTSFIEAVLEHLLHSLLGGL